jgi:antitoxin CptB
MRELDVLLLGYLEHHYAAAPDDEKAAFRELLALSDPELIGYLLHNERPPRDLARVVEELRSRTDA